MTIEPHAGDDDENVDIEFRACRHVSGIIFVRYIQNQNIGPPPPVPLQKQMSD